MSKVVIEHMNGIHYPLPDDNFNPDKCYPEYPFGSKEISTKPNNAYELVRNCLADMGLDEKHHGTEQWNPLGAYIKPGDFVVIKPNLVMHVNENKHASENAFECLITNPACIRAICDYCIIALSGSGRLMIGDAPMQGCDFDALLKKSNLPKVIDFYKGWGIMVELEDFRQYQSKFNANKVIVDKKYNDTQGIVVHMGAKSQHMGSNSNGIYQVSDYDKADTAAFHHDAVHDYEINRDILQADVVINLCNSHLQTHIATHTDHQPRPAKRWCHQPRAAANRLGRRIAQRHCSNRCPPAVSQSGYTGSSRSALQEQRPCRWVRCPA